MSNSVDPDEMAHICHLIWIYAVCKSLLLSPVAVKVKESHSCSILPVTLKIIPLSISKYEQNLRRYLDVYVLIFCLVLLYVCETNTGLSGDSLSRGRHLIMTIPVHRCASVCVYALNRWKTREIRVLR